MPLTVLWNPPLFQQIWNKVRRQLPARTSQIRHCALAIITVVPCRIKAIEPIFPTNSISKVICCHLPTCIWYIGKPLCNGTLSRHILPPAIYLPEKNGLFHIFNIVFHLSTREFPPHPPAISPATSFIIPINLETNFMVSLKFYRDYPSYLTSF